MMAAERREQRQGGAPHEAALRREAMQLRAGGWSLRQIRGIFAARGIAVHESTIFYWTDEEASERRRTRDRERNAIVNAARSTYRWPGRPRTDAWIFGRMAVLRGAGLSMAAIAKVIAIDHGLQMTEHQVRYALNTQRPPALERVAA